MATHFRRERIDFNVSFDHGNDVHAHEREATRIRATTITTTEAARDNAISDLIDDDGWLVAGVVPIIVTRNHKPDRQEVQIPYTYTAGMEVILYKNGDD